MNTTTVAKGGAAGGVAYALVVLLTGVLNHYRITLTQSQSDAILTLTGLGLHALSVHGWPRLWNAPAKAGPKAATPSTEQPKA